MKITLTSGEMMTLRDALDDFLTYTGENLHEGEWYRRAHAETKSMINKLIGTTGKDCVLTTIEEE